MISTRTKQINVYGKRPRRIIQAPSTEDFVYDQPPDAAKPDRVPLIHRMKKRENSGINAAAKSKPSSPPRAVLLTKQRVMPSWSPKRKDAKRGTRVAEILVQETTKLRVRDAGGEETGDKKGVLATPSRKPLSTITINAMNSPVPSCSKVATAKMHKKPAASPKGLVTAKALSTVQMDIEVLNAKGQTLKQEKRVTRTDVVINKTTAVPLVPPTRQQRHLSSRPAIATSEIIIVDSSVDEIEIPESDGEPQPAIISIGSTATNDSSLELRPVRRPKHAVARLVISDDSEDECDDDYLPPPDPLPTKSMRKSLAPRRSMAVAPKIDAPQRPSLPRPSGLKVEVVVPPARYKLPSRPTKPAIPAPAPHLPEKNAQRVQKTHVRDTHTHLSSKLEAKPLPAPTLMNAARSGLGQPRYPSYNPIPSPPLKPRSLTPIRNGKTSASRFSFTRAPPAPPTPTTLTDSEFDLSLDFSFDLAPEDLEALQVPDKQAKYLRPLLEECHQEHCGAYEFSAFIKTFPFDPILQDARDLAEKRNEEFRFRKIGEASYSEVFGIGDVVLKVIPLRDESRQRTIQEEDEEEDGPAPTDARDVRKEIIVTRAMGEVHERFVKLLKTYVVRGKYPEVLLNLWDEYHERKGSESVRPDTFTASQMYAIIALPNGGPDLEAYTFTNPSKTGWRQACSLFWQVAKTLAHAEQLVSFEHRDLHWGQILVKDLPPANKPAPLRSLAHTLNQTKPTTAQRVYMDDLVHGVEATIIDLGLSRMDAGDGGSGERVHWTPFDEEMFMGEGDYQFDVYRCMREHTSENWEAFHPLTNVMWLHYLATKLLRYKNLKPPSAPRKPRAVPPPPQDTAFPHSSIPSSPNSTTQFTEKDCFDTLVDVEEWLGRCIADIALAVVAPKGKARGPGGRPRKTAAVIKPIGGTAACACAGEVVGYGVKRGWIRAVS